MVVLRITCLINNFESSNIPVFLLCFQLNTAITIRRVYGNILSNILYIVLKIAVTIYFTGKNKITHRKNVCKRISTQAVDRSSVPTCILLIIFIL